MENGGAKMKMEPFNMRAFKSPHHMASMVVSPSTAHSQQAIGRL